MKLARKIILLMVATFLVVISIVGYVEGQRRVREHRARVAAELAITGRALRAPLGEVLEVEGEGRALKLIERADTDITSMEIRLDSRLERLDANARAKLARGEEVTVDRKEAENKLYVYVPVATHGAIELSRSLSDERGAVLAIVEERFVLGLIAVLGAALVSIVASLRLVGRPMRRLAQQARRIGAGDLSRRLTVLGRDEMGELAVEMNGMCDRLREAHTRIEAEADAKVKTMEQLRRADRLSTVGRLASGMAHELGTPLSVISGRAKMIATGDASPKESIEYAKVISGQVDKMTKVMRGLLDFARSTPTKKTPNDLRDVVKRIIDLLAPLAHKHAVELELAPGNDPALVEVDPAQVEQAVANLVVNAIQSIEGDSGGNVVADVRRVRAAPPGSTDVSDFVCVSVTDTGLGIRAEDLPHVFEPFYTTKDVGAGTGLGLSVTYGIVQDHAGFVDVESELGKGSRFALFFPA